MQYDFFINHCLSEKEIIAIPIYMRLKELGFSVWLDIPSICCGDNIFQEIENGIHHSSWSISIISNNFLHKPWPKKELEIFLAIGKKMKENKVLPLFYKIQKEEVYPAFPQLIDIAFESVEDNSNDLWVDKVLCRFISSFFARITLNITWEEILDILKNRKNKHSKYLFILTQQYIYNLSEISLTIINLYNIIGLCILLSLESENMPTREMYIGFNFIQRMVTKIFNREYTVSIYDIETTAIIARNSICHVIDTFKN